MMRDDEKDERKNFFISENFSALHALNSDDMHDDDDDYEYPIFDHIGKCRFMLPRTHPDFLDSEMKNQLPRQSEESKRKQEALKARAMRLRDAEKKFAQREASSRSGPIAASSTAGAARPRAGKSGRSAT